MKKNVWIGLILTIMGAKSPAFAQSRLNLEGTLVGNEKMVYLQKYERKVFVTIDSSKVDHGTFSFKTKMLLPELYGISVDTAKTPFYVFLDEGPISVVLNPADNYKQTVVKGSPAQDLFEEYKSDKQLPIADFIREHPSSIVAAYALNRNWAYRLTPDEIDANLSLFDKSLDNSPYLVELRALVQTMDLVGVGKTAPDFKAPDTAGKEMRLSDIKAKYILVDFWASWCAPCRKENPNVVKAFQRFKDKGFTVLGVSLDKNAVSWRKAIHDDQLAWNHVSELNYWKSEIAKQYGVRAIPANFLIDEKGTIVAKNLRGEKLLSTLAELLD